jgi:quercetin 2,3-dioxygenase
MITIRKSEDRGFTDAGWLRSHATFSFGRYQDPNFVGFRALRVLNEDRIAPGKGFGPHSHRDMEILTYMVDGRLAHRDSLTGPHVLGANELQVMTAGDGIVHSEFNASDTEPSHSLQIWIDPRAEDLVPSYRQIGFAPEAKRGRLHLLAGPESADEAHTAVINQDARVYVAEIGANDRVTHTLGEDRHAWIQVVRGAIDVNGSSLLQGDGAAISDEQAVVLSGNGEVLLFDLA